MPETTFSFFVPGCPKPGGSKRGFPFQHKSGKVGVRIVEDCKKNAGWRECVVVAASQHRPPEPFDCALEVVVTFHMPRPKSHFGTGKNANVLKDNAPSDHTSKPDATKLWRAAEDALTRVMWRDDSLICRQNVSKIYSMTPGMQIVIRPRVLGALP